MTYELLLTRRGYSIARDGREVIGDELSYHDAKTIIDILNNPESVDPCDRNADMARECGEMKREMEATR